MHGAYKNSSGWWHISIICWSYSWNSCLFFPKTDPNRLFVKGNFSELRDIIIIYIQIQEHDAWYTLLFILFSYSKIKKLYIVVYTCMPCDWVLYVSVHRLNKNLTDFILLDLLGLPELTMPALPSLRWTSRYFWPQSIHTGLTVALNSAGRFSSRSARSPL